MKHSVADAIASIAISAPSGALIYLSGSNALIDVGLVSEIAIPYQTHKLTAYLGPNDPCSYALTEGEAAKILSMRNGISKAEAMKVIDEMVETHASGG